MGVLKLCVPWLWSQCLAQNFGGRGVSKVAKGWHRMWGWGFASFLTLDYLLTVFCLTLQTHLQSSLCEPLSEEPNRMLH